MQLHTDEHRPRSLGVAMKRYPSLVWAAIILSSGCAHRVASKAPVSGVIEAPSGGSVGYQHGVDRSRFIVGANRRTVSEYGFAKVVGSEGAFAVDVKNGAVIALPNASSPEQRKPVWYTGSADEHNRQVFAYFVACGIPKEQIASVSATTFLSASNGEASADGRSPKIAGWQSILQRRVGEIEVVDSVVWARMNDQGRVLSEWVFWPALPSNAITEAGQLRSKLAAESERATFLASLPSGLPSGKVVIRHSSAVSSEPFEAFASYDVLQPLDVSSASQGESAAPGISVVRHFDINGKERKLAEETAKAVEGKSKAKPAPSSRQGP